MKPFERLTNAGQLRCLRRLAVQALAGYDIHAAHLAPLQHEANTTFRVDSANGERYVLRIHHPRIRTPASVRSELMWLAALRGETDFVVPEPIPAQHGDLLMVTSVEEVPGARICVLFRWIDGRFLDARLTPSHLERVGAFMAGLQAHAVQFHPPDHFARGRVDTLTQDARRVAAQGIHGASAREQIDNPADEATAIALVREFCSAGDAELVTTLIRRLREIQQRVGQTADVFGLIHADLHQENYFFQHGQVRAIDFDDCGYGHYLYDMAVTLSEVNWRKNTPELRRGFLTGYRSVRELSPEHAAYLDTFMTFRDLQLMIWKIEMRNHPAFRVDWAEDVKVILNDIRTFIEK